MSAADESSAEMQATVAEPPGEGDGFELGTPIEGEPQVSPLIAIIRIIAVLGMGLSVSFGLFIMLVGVKGIIIGVPIVLLAVPCYIGMQFAERLATRAEARAPEDAAP